MRQPWAWAIARGYKPVENRVWVTSYRGPVAIHAAKRPDAPFVHALGEILTNAHAEGHELPHSLRDDLPHSGYGLVIAVAELVDICTVSHFSRTVRCGCGRWAQPMQTHWQLVNVRLLPHPVAATGHLGLWNWNGEAA